MNPVAIIILMLAITACGQTQHSTAITPSANMIDTTITEKIKPVNFELLDEPDISIRKGSVHFFTIGKDKYSYTGDIKTDQGMIQAHMESVPVILVSFDGNFYMLGGSYFNYRNRFEWYAVTDRKIKNAPLQSLPGDFYRIEFKDSNLNFLYKIFYLMQIQERSAVESYQLFKTYLTQSPDFLFYQPHGSYYLTYINEMVKSLKKDTVQGKELYGILKELLYRFPKECREGDLSETAQSLIAIDSVNGVKEIKTFEAVIKADILKNPGASDKRLNGLKTSLTKIRISEILNTDLYLEFRKMCESQNYIYETYYVDYSKKDLGPEDGGLFYKRPSSALKDLKFSKGHGFHIALMYNRGYPFMEIKLASAYYADVLPFNKTYILSPRRSFTQEETAQIVRAGNLPEEVFSLLEKMAQDIKKR